MIVEKKHTTQFDSNSFKCLPRNQRIRQLSNLKEPQYCPLLKNPSKFASFKQLLFQGLIIAYIQPISSIILLQMSSKSSPQKKQQSKIIQAIKYPLISKVVIDKRPPQLSIIDKTGLYKPDPPDLLSFLVMKDKFQNIYQKIQQLASPPDYFPKQEKEEIIATNVLAVSDFPFKAIHSNQKGDFQQFCKLRTSLLHPARRHSNYEPSSELQINNSDTSVARHKGEYSLADAFIRRSRYQNKHLQPLGNGKLSNNIKDYLSVQRIPIKDLEESMLNKSKLYKKYHLSKLLNSSIEVDQTLNVDKDISEISLSPKKTIPKLSPKKYAKFKPPFQMYYYRDFLWKVSSSNNLIMDIPEQYPQKIKFFVGGGNNSNLIKGLMKRRPWFQLTEKAQDAQFVWTQIKIPSIFVNQPKRQNQIIYSQQELKELGEKSQCNKKICKKDYSIMNAYEKQKWNLYWNLNQQLQIKLKPNMTLRNKKFKSEVIQLQKRGQIKIHNHLCNNFIIGNKKALFQTMSQYYQSLKIDVFSKLPLTFHITSGLEDDQYLKFLQHYYAISKANKSNPDSLHKYNAWIVKPGENTNRGNGITVCLQLNEIKSILKSKQKHRDGSTKTYILQKYIQKPLLYKKRKFDIRHYIMLNCSGGIMRGYWYRHGYVRTTSSQYTLKIGAGAVHLTNDAVQKYLPDYGKYEKANKVTYEQLQSFIKKSDPQFDFFGKVYPRMKQLATDAIRASAFNIDPQRRLHNFQIFGLDFMIDESYNVWLIEVNANPCLQTNCQVLSQIIPQFVQNTLEICLDPLFPPPLSFIPKHDLFLSNTTSQNNFDLIFDERIDGIHQVGSQALKNPQQDDDLFDDDGQDFNDEAL